MGLIKVLTKIFVIILLAQQPQPLAAAPTNTTSIAKRQDKEPRTGSPWLFNSQETIGYQCAIGTNQYRPWDVYRLSGRGSPLTEKEVKKAFKKAGAVTKWRWKQFEGGDFEARCWMPLFAYTTLFIYMEELTGIENLCSITSLSDESWDP